MEFFVFHFLSFQYAVVIFWINFFKFLINILPLNMISELTTFKIQCHLCARVSSLRFPRAGGKIFGYICMSEVGRALSVYFPLPSPSASPSKETESAAAEIIAELPIYDHSRRNSYIYTSFYLSSHLLSTESIDCGSVFVASVDWNANRH